MPQEMQILIKDPETQSLNTDGYLVVYFDKEMNIRLIGKIDRKAVMPLIAKSVLQKFM